MKECLFKKVIALLNKPNGFHFSTNPDDGFRLVDGRLKHAHASGYWRNTTVKGFLLHMQREVDKVIDLTPNPLNIYFDSPYDLKCFLDIIIPVLRFYE